MTLPAPDLSLARRLERAEGAANAAFVEARARAEPAVGARWIDVAGAYAMFDGLGSPLTQAFGVGIFEPFGAQAFEHIESFYGALRSATTLEVSSLASDESTRLLPARGYVMTEQSTVLIRATTAPDEASPSLVTVRRIDPHEAEAWATVSGTGWSSAGAGMSAFVTQLGRVLAQANGATCFIAELDAQPIAAAALNLTGGVALLAGASTIPAARGRGAQRALLAARLAYAASEGIALAMVVTQPEGASLRNAERVGFRPVYGRTKWERPLHMG